ETYDGSSALNVYITEIGVYVDGLSKCAENEAEAGMYELEISETLDFGFYVGYMYSVEFEVENQSFSMGVSGLDSIVGGSPRSDILYYYDLYNGEYYRNLGDLEGLLYDGVMFFGIEGNFNMSAFSNLFLGAVMLTDGVDEVLAQLSSGNVNVNESYFYEENHRLYYQLYADDANEEYIQASFDIDNIAADNYSLYFYGYKTSEDFDSLFYLYYSDSDFELFNMTKLGLSYAQILPELKHVDKYVINITDNDEMENGVVRGYIDDFSLEYIGSSGFTLIPQELLYLMIILIVLIVPTLAISQAIESRTGKKGMGKRALLPIFMMMTIVLFIVELIDTWLFIIFIATFLGLFLIQNRDSIKERVKR
ncbi:MAG: hypothetical protein ACQERX_05215, partial [Bacillota bacterium]